MIFITFFYEGNRGHNNISNSTEFSSQIARFYLAGTFTFMSATISLLLALSWGGTTYAWGTARIVALLTLAGFLFCSFFGIEYWMKDSAITPLRLLRRRSIIAAISIVGALMYDWKSLKTSKMMGAVNVIVTLIWITLQAFKETVE